MGTIGRFFKDVVPGDRQERKYLLLYLKGLAKSVRLAVAEEEVEPFRDRLFSPGGAMSIPSPFYWLSTYNGKEALISLPDVEYVNFLFEMERPITALLASSIPKLDVRAKEDRQDGTVDLYFRGRPAPITLRVDNSEKLKEIFEELAGKQLSEVFSYVSFRDDEGQLIAFRPDRLMLLLAHRGSIQMTTEEEYEALFRSD